MCSDFIILGAPDPPAGRPTVVEPGEDYATLVWSGSTYDGGSVITGYTVEMRTGGGSWKTIAQR